MAVYEALLLNTVVPQIQAAQAGDSYVMVVNATTPALRITQTGTGDSILVEDAANPDSSPFVVTAAGDVGIGTNTPEKKLHVVGPQNGTNESGATAFIGGAAVGEMRMYAGVNDAGNYGYLGTYEIGIAYRDLVLQPNGGNLGLGVTPSAWRSNTPAFQIGSAGVCLFADSGVAGELGNNLFLNSSSQYIYLRADPASRYKQHQGVHSWLVSTNTPVIGDPIVFSTAMTLDASGNLLVGTTSAIQGGKYSSSFDGQTVNGIVLQTTYTTAGTTFIRFVNSSGTAQGEISANATNTVAYSTSSDYRLKDNITPMSGALAKVAALKPVTYKWKADGSDGEGFIAHELQAVVPQCVTGEKDAVDAEGKPVHQGIDTSFLVATLTAAIQEQQAMINELKAEVAALKGA
jgi:hypothetical protein